MVKNPADIGKRILGGIIDFVVVFLIFMAGTSILAYFFGEVEKFHFGFKAYVSGPPVLIILLIVFLYFIIMEATTGKTIGKYIVKTKVVNKDGKKISWKQSIVRNLMRAVDGVFFYMIGFIAIYASKNNQRLGDMISKTYVINDNKKKQK